MDVRLLHHRVFHFMAFLGSVCYCLKIPATSESQTNRDIKCRFGDHLHEVGDRWHPVVKPNGIRPCVNCSCHPNGKVKCVTSPCPRVTCDRPRLVSGQCCPICNENAHVAPTVAPNDGNSEKRGLRSCRYYGKHYHHGVTFPSNKTAIRPTRKSQCVLCACMDSKVVCYLKSCPVLKCKDQVLLESNTCCPMCKADLELLFKPEYWERKGVSHRQQLESTNPPSNDTDGDCINDGEIRQNGSVWHPYVLTFGTMRCIVCACVNGQMSCRRVACEAERSLTCNYPRRINGECCLSCPKRRGRKRGKKRKGRRTNRKNKGKTGVRRRNRKKNNGHKKISRRKKNGRRRDYRKKSGGPRHGRRGSGNIMGIINGTTELSHIDAMLKDLCLPLRSDRLIYTTKTQNVFIISFDVYQKGVVEVYEWSVTKGRITQMKKVTVPTNLFRKDYKISKIVGATNKRNFRRFRHRLEKHMSKCRLKSRPCKLRSVERLLRRIRTRNVRYWKTCPQLPRPAS